MKKTKEEMLQNSLDNQNEIIGRLRILQKQLNQIIPQPIKYSKKTRTDLVNAKEAANHLNISETQFYVRLNNDEFPVYFEDGEAGRRVSIKDLNEWITKR